MHGKTIGKRKGEKMEPEGGGEGLKGEYTGDLVGNCGKRNSFAAEDHCFLSK